MTQSNIDDNNSNAATASADPASTTGAKKPRTPAQVQASRTNGAKSKGPVTDEGKDAIKFNRLLHGFRAGPSTTLLHEDRAAYNEHLDAYMQRYQPIDKVERDLVGLAASNMWQVMRNNSIEVALLDLEFDDIDEERDIVDKFHQMDNYGRLALAFRKAHKENSIELLRRYKSTAERAFHRAFQALEQIRRERGSSSMQHQQPAPPPPDTENVESTVRTQEASEPQAAESKETTPTPKPFLIVNTHKATPSTDNDRNQVDDDDDDEAAA